jgi:hypothetical protein
MHPTWCPINGALNYVEFRAALNLTWFRAHSAIGTADFFMGDPELFIIDRKMKFWL